MQDEASPQHPVVVGHLCAVRLVQAGSQEV